MSPGPPGDFPSAVTSRGKAPQDESCGAFPIGEGRCEAALGLQLFELSPFDLPEPLRELERRLPTAPDFLVEDVRLEAAAARCVLFEPLRAPDLAPDLAPDFVPDRAPPFAPPFAAVLRPADFVAPPRLDERAADFVPDDRVEDFDADLVPERADDREADLVPDLAPDFVAALLPPDRDDLVADLLPDLVDDFVADLVPDFAADFVPDFEPDLLPVFDEDFAADFVPDLAALFFAPDFAALFVPAFLAPPRALPDFAVLFFAPVDALLREDVPLRARPLREPLPAPPAADPPVLFSSCMVFDLSSVAIIASFKDPRVSTVTLDQGNVIIWSRFRKWISP